MESLTGSAVCLRGIRAEDEVAWLAWLREPEIMVLMDMVDVVTDEQHRRFLQERIHKNPAARWFAIERDGQFIGKVWLWDIHWRHRRAEVRILVGDRAHWGSGAGSDALRIIAHHAFRTLGLHKLYAFVHQDNPRSRAAFLRAGFSDEALLKQEAYRSGTFQDVWRLAIFAPDEP